MRSVIVTALLLVAPSASTAAGAPLWGLGRAIDGDSLMVGETEVRLHGIDAPELHQTCTRNGEPWRCGAEAADLLARLATGQQVRCSAVGTDDYGRTLGRCTVGSTDLNRTMVARGLAVAFRRYSSDYVPAEDHAKAGRLGLWSSTFEMPSQYRHPQGAGGSAGPTPRSRSRASPPGGIRTRQAQAACAIKGNRNRRGQWIYHLPGMPYYDQTRPEEIFCTEAEAQAAGYRRAIIR